MNNNGTYFHAGTYIHGNLFSRKRRAVSIGGILSLLQLRFPDLKLEIGKSEL